MPCRDQLVELAGAMETVPEYIVRARSSERFVRQVCVSQRVDGRLSETIRSRVCQHVIQFREEIDKHNAQVRLSLAVRIHGVDEGRVEAGGIFAIPSEQDAIG